MQDRAQDNVIGMLVEQIRELTSGDEAAYLEQLRKVGLDAEEAERCFRVRQAKLAEDAAAKRD